MKKYIRVLSCVLLLAMLISAFSIDCYAAETEDTKKPEYTRRTCSEISVEAISEIKKVLKDSLSVGVRSVEQTPVNAAILMGDGTVRAFLYAFRYSVCDYGQCEVSSWKGIQAIACNGTCTYGLTEEGALVWAGLPNETYYSGTDYTKDEGWIKITSCKGYQDIACVGSSLFALRADGKIDVAFKPEEGKYNNSAREMCDEAEKLYNITDIASAGFALYALNSSGQIKILGNTDSYGDTNTTVSCGDAVSLKLHEGAMCAVTSTGGYDVIDDLDAESVPDVKGGYFSTSPNFFLNTDIITHVWSHMPYVPGCWLFRDVYGGMGRIWSRPGQSADFTGAVFSSVFGDWLDVEDAYVFRFALPYYYTMSEDGPAAEEDTERFWLDVTLGVKKSGECVADYHFTASRPDGMFDA